MKCIVVSLGPGQAQPSVDFFPALLEEFFSIQGMSVEHSSHVLGQFRSWIGARVITRLELSCLEGAIHIEVVMRDGGRDDLTLTGFDCRVTPE